MIKNYKPSDKNTHIVKVSFNYEGYCGYVTLPITNSLKGANVISLGLNFLKNCNDDTIAIIDNECNLSYVVNTNTFKIKLRNHYGDIRQFNSLMPSELLNIITGIEIINCIPNTMRM